MFLTSLKPLLNLYLCILSATGNGSRNINQLSIPNSNYFLRSTHCRVVVVFIKRTKKKNRTTLSVLNVVSFRLQIQTPI